MNRNHKIKSKINDLIRLKINRNNKIKLKEFI